MSFILPHRPLSFSKNELEPSSKPYVSAIAKDVEVVSMKRDEGQGKANSVSGIPLPGTIVQVQGKSVEPNRKEPDKPFKIDGTGENYARDYFDAESARLGNLEDAFVIEKSDQTWSSGLQDEENTSENAVDADDSEGHLPESQPLQLDSDVRFGADHDEPTLPSDKFDNNSV
jgi:hypothetical protein